jgi:hypothetical protein
MFLSFFYVSCFEKTLLLEFIIVENNVYYVEAFVPRISLMLDLVELYFRKNYSAAVFKIFSMLN